MDEILKGWKTKIAGILLIGSAIFKSVVTMQFTDFDLELFALGLGFLGIAYKLDRQ
jgi:hypothetical protein